VFQISFKYCSHLFNVIIIWKRNLIPQELETLTQRVIVSLCIVKLILIYVCFWFYIALNFRTLWSLFPKGASNFTFSMMGLSVITRSSTWGVCLFYSMVGVFRFCNKKLFLREFTNFFSMIFDVSRLFQLIFGQLKSISS